MSDHEHKWTSSMHADGCHFFVWTYQCACGATASTTTERDLESDPYSAVWMDDGEGRDEPCVRCGELFAGARPTHSVVVIAKDGTVERDETTVAA